MTFTVDFWTMAGAGTFVLLCCLGIRVIVGRPVRQDSADVVKWQTIRDWSSIGRHVASFVIAKLGENGKESKKLREPSEPWRLN